MLKMDTLFSRDNFKFSVAQVFLWHITFLLYLYLEVCVVEIFVNLELDILRNEADEIEADVAFVLRNLDGVHV